MLTNAEKKENFSFFIFLPHRVNLRVSKYVSHFTKVSSTAAVGMSKKLSMHRTIAKDSICLIKSFICTSIQSVKGEGKKSELSISRDPSFILRVNTVQQRRIKKIN